MDQIHLDIVTPERLAYSEDVHFVSVPTTNGTLGILPKHTNLVSQLVEGEIKIETNGKEMYLAIGGGFMEVTKDHILILVSRAYNADELNESEIKKAYVAAKEALSQKGKAADYAAAQAILRRSTVELHVLRRKKPRLTM
ncbi:MAG: ATP synthase epsilon chain [Microgenomates group bacterium GW2011_GWB1_40_9]|nr:MAG: F0F1 ATP synthase subunit epsilon, F-type H+-transporting ATPase subunit epsilon [Microgenomates group bacterium GW2011_GWC1_39_12]KKR79945.1 MAG: ATP synthase epsilon chain [Microgenomates group bacterium GW2011_GWB1_40_9]